MREKGTVGMVGGKEGMWNRRVVRKMSEYREQAGGGGLISRQNSWPIEMASKAVITQVIKISRG